MSKMVKPAEMVPVGEPQIAQNGVIRPTPLELDSLSGKQKAFIDHYLLSFNAKQAALAAGYSETRPDHRGWQLLRHPIVGREIRFQQAATAEEMGITREWILHKLREIADVTMDMESDREIDPRAAATALEKLAKLRGDLIDRHEIEQKVLVVQLNDVDAGDLT